MSVHADAVAVLSAWAAPSPDQEQLRRHFLGHLAAHPNGADRECTPEHLTAGGLVFDPDRARTLLVLHGRIGAWVQPGGHCEPVDASVSGAVLREVGEETGLVDVTVSSAPFGLSRHAAPCKSGARWHLDVKYTVTAPAYAEPSVSTESLDVRWFPVDALPDPLASGVAESIAAVVAAHVDGTAHQRGRVRTGADG